MKDAPPLLLLLLFPLLLANLHSASASISQSIGIPPRDLKYFEGSTFWCKDGSKRIPKERLNDNFCDCEDGTDEPGTSACPTSKFYCKNVGYVPQSLYSSRVNDGICDCCDGSDEYDGSGKCVNTCWEAGKASRENLVKKVNVYKEGLKIRRSEIENAKKSRQQNDVTLKGLRTEEKLLNERVQRLKAQKDSIEEREKRERLAKEKADQAEAERKLKEEKTAADKADPQPTTDVVEVISDDEAQNTDPETETESEVESAPIADDTAKEAPEVHLTELQEEPKLDELSNEELGRVVAARWTGEDTTVHVPEETLDHHPAYEAAENHDNEADFDSDETELEDNEEDDYAAFREEEQVPETPPEPRKLAWWERFIPGALKRIYNREPVNKSEADRIRNQYSEASSKLATVQHQISELESKAKGDFGPEGEFYSFSDKCFELKVQKYNYKVCPYKNAIQEEGHLSTRLGNWDGFKDNYTAMMFSSGDRCWNGPDRSLRVKLRCGVRSELRNVDEPSRCDYTAELVTPTFCLESKLQELQNKLDQQLSGLHDEL